MDYSDDACMKEFTPIQIQRIKDMVGYYRYQRSRRRCARSGLRSFAKSWSEFEMRLRVLAVLVLLGGSTPAVAADGGPPLVELMIRPNYLTAYKTMIGTTTVSPWVVDFAKTLDGPPVPSADLLAGGTIYTLAFTCKPNECADHQLFVLFTGDGSRAWGFLIEAEQQTWLGDPDDKIKEAILSRVE